MAAPVEHRASRPPPGPGTRGRAPYLVTAGVLLATIAVSQAIPAAKHAFGANVPPLFASLHVSIGPGVLLPLALAALAVWGGPRLLRAPTWMFLPAVVAFGWCLAVSLAAEAHGLSGVTAPFRRPLDYWANVPLVRSMGPREFAERFPQLVGRLSLHARTHPPGAVLFLWAVSELGAGVTAASLLVALVGALGAVPTYALARVGGERVGRLAALLFACAPGVLLYSATSMDAVFMTVVAIALAALVRAPRSNAWAAGAGALTALALSVTFGAVMLAPVGVGIGIVALRDARRSGGPGPDDPKARAPALLRRGLLAVIGLVAGAVVIRLAAGIDLMASLRAAARAHLGDPSRARPYLYWLFADVPAFLIVAGLPQAALLAGETRIRWHERRAGLETVLWATLVIASASGLFLGEVDHIWLLLIPLLVAPAAAFLARDHDPDGRVLRWVVGVALGQALLMQVLLYTFW